MLLDQQRIVGYLVAKMNTTWTCMFKGEILQRKAIVKQTSEDLAYSTGVNMATLLKLPL